MNLGRTVFAQLISFLPDREFRRCVSRYDGDRRWRSFSCWDQFPIDGVRPVDLPRKPPRYRSVPAFARRQALPHGILLPGGRAPHWPTPTNRADWRIYADFAQVLDSHRAAPCTSRDPIGVDLDQSLYALDSTTIDLWPLAVPVGNVPTAQGCREDAHPAGPAGQYPPHLSALPTAKVHDVNILDENRPRARRLLRYGSSLRRFRTPLRVHPLLVVSSSFVPRRTFSCSGVYSHPVDKSTGLRSDQTVILTAIESAKAYPDSLRRVSYFDAATKQAAEVSDQQLRAPGADYRPHLQVALADRVVLQVDQAALADQEVLRCQRERREDSNLDRCLGLRAGRDRAQKGWAWRRVSTKSYRFSALLFSKKTPIFRGLANRSTPTTTYLMTLTS